MLHLQRPDAYVVIGTCGLSHEYKFLVNAFLLLHMAQLGISPTEYGGQQESSLEIISTLASDIFPLHELLVPFQMITNALKYLQLLNLNIQDISSTHYSLQEKAPSLSQLHRILDLTASKELVELLRLQRGLFPGLGARKP